MKGKWLTGVLVLAMAAVTLAGCGAKDETKEMYVQLQRLINAEKNSVTIEKV